MPLPLVFVLYFLSAAVLVFFSIKCADYVDLLDKKTNMSGAFIGGVILAAVTSLPELVTSLSAVYIVDNPSLIIGNVLGSNIFNLCIFGGSVILAAKAFSKTTIGKAHLATSLCTLVAFGLIAVVFWVGTGDTVFGQIPVVNINIMSLLILVVYFISFRFLSTDDTDNSEEDTSPLTVRQIIVRFIFMALGLVAMSMAVTWLTDELQSKLEWLDASLAGAIFLGVATSLPELSSSIALVRRRNFNAMVGNVLGSNMFNFTIFSVADIFAFRAIYPAASSVSHETKNMLIFGVLSTLLVMGTIMLQGHMKKKNHKGVPVVYAVLGVAVIASYVVSLVLPVSPF